MLHSLLLTILLLFAVVTVYHILCVQPTLASAMWIYILIIFVDF